MFDLALLLPGLLLAMPYLGLRLISGNNPVRMGNKGFGNLVTVAVGLVILVVLVTSVMLPTLKNTNTTGWTSQETQIWNILGLMIILGVLVFVVYSFISRRK